MPIEEIEQEIILSPSRKMEQDDILFGENRFQQIVGAIVFLGNIILYALLGKLIKNLFHGWDEYHEMIDDIRRDTGYGGPGGSYRGGEIFKGTGMRRL